MRGATGRRAIALLVGALGCGTASAEVFGAVDLAVTRLHGGGRPAQWRIDSGGLGASHLGFRIHEPLKRGLRLTAVLEHGFDADTGGAADTTRTSFNRQAWTGLAMSLGEFRVGRQASPQYELMTRFDVYEGQPFGSALANTSALSERFDKNRYVLGVEYLRGAWHARAAITRPGRSRSTSTGTSAGPSARWSAARWPRGRHETMPGKRACWRATGCRRAPACTQSLRA